MNRIVHWWRHLSWFEVRRARMWQTVIQLTLVSVLLLTAYAVANFY